MLTPVWNIYPLPEENEGASAGKETGQAEAPEGGFRLSTLYLQEDRGRKPESKR